MFGSYYTNLFLPAADVDISVTELPCENGVFALKMLSDRMLRAGELADVEVVDKARVPIAKLVEAKTGLQADISVSSEADPLETSRYIKQHLEKYPVMRPMIMFLKFYLAQRDLNETYKGGIGSYLLTFMVLHLLRRHEACHDAGKYAKTSLGHFLIDFFRYYGKEFRYDSHGISVREGEPPLYEKNDRGWFNENKPWALSVESPLDPEQDIGGKAYAIRAIKLAFQHAFHTLWGFLSSKDDYSSRSAFAGVMISCNDPTIARRHTMLQPLPPCVTAEEVKRLTGKEMLKRPAPEVNSAEQSEEEQPAKKRRRAEPEPAVVIGDSTPEQDDDEILLVD